MVPARLYLPGSMLRLTRKTRSFFAAFLVFHTGSCSSGSPCCGGKQKEDNHPPPDP